MAYNGEISEMLTKACCLGYELNRKLSYASQSYYEVYKEDKKGKAKEYLMQAKERLVTLQSIVDETLALMK